MSDNKPATQPQRLPFCEYPLAKDTDQHGLQPLPQELPLVNIERAQPYRSIKYKTVVADTLEPDQILHMARVVAKSFAKRESMFRHLNLPKYPAYDVSEITHTDNFGTAKFGEWVWANRTYWSIRLNLVSDSVSQDAVNNDDPLAKSLAITDNRGTVIGGVFNTTKSPPPQTPPPVRDEPYLKAITFESTPFYDLIRPQTVQVLDKLCSEYPAFKHAYNNHKLGYCDMVARSDALPTLDTFELIAATIERLQMLGYEYLMTSATNQWTGAAFEVLGGIRVHFAPFRTKKFVQESADPIPDKFSSSDGFISAKDSGCMKYVIRLK